MGHSLAGYFTGYALLQHLSDKSHGISNYIAASPSLHYNHYYLFGQLKKISAAKKAALKGYFTFGGLEDNENEGDSGLLKQKEVSEQ